MILTPKQRLKAIEGLTIFFDDTNRSLKAAKGILEKIYMLSHINGSCKNKHEDWQKKAVATYKSLIKNGII